MRCWLAGGVLWVVMALATPPVRADGAIDAWAEWIVSQRAYGGPRVPYPDAVARPPAQVWVLDSERFPVHLQAGPGVDHARASRALAALEEAWEVLSGEGWPLPLPDGGHGGTAGYDVYLRRDAWPAGAEVEHPVAWRDTDSATAHGWLDPELSGAELSACAMWTVVEGGLIGLDPAEPRALRRATAAAGVYLSTGGIDCGDAATDAQHSPGEGWLGTGDPEADAGGLFLAALSERHDGGSGRFLRALWELGRQDSEGVAALHASPGLGEVIAQALAQAGEDPEQLVVDVAVARYFAGLEARRRASTYRVFGALPESASVPVREARPFARLPHHLPAAEPPLWPNGSAYAHVDTRGAPTPSQLRVWLRGEHGARWSLVAVRLAADGRELGRVEAPARTRVAKGYLPVELSPDTTGVLLVVTRLPARGKQTAHSDAEPHSFRLIVDR